MRILGIDPGLDVTGYGFIDTAEKAAFRLIEAGLIRTPKTESLPRRLWKVGQQLRVLMEQHHPDFVAVEDLYSYYKTPQPAILMGHVRGVVLEAAAQAGVSVESYLPTRVKHAVVGRGHASKDQIARMVRMRLKLNDEAVPPDVTDALAVALCHAESAKKKALFS